MVELIVNAAPMSFSRASEEVGKYVDAVAADDFVDVLEQIGTIPEAIGHDTTEEKLFAKASDAVLSRAFREIGLKSAVLRERADSADVQAESPIFGYTLVADAKAFRMSRTAKNQKDFKVVSLSGWRKDADYAVLCSPYFQYPKSESQIYAHAIEHNVCLLAWESLIFLIKRGIKENVGLNLSPIWSFSQKLSQTVLLADKKRCFLDDYNKAFLSVVAHSSKDFSSLLKNQIAIIEQRGYLETDFWNNERATIMKYSKEKAINELIKTKKIDEKIQQIEKFVKGLCCE